MSEAPVNGAELEASRIKDRLNSGDIKKEEIDAIAATLNQKEVRKSLIDLLDSAFAESIIAKLNQKSTLSDADRAIMNLIYELHPLLIESRIASTERLSGKVSAVLNGGGNALNFEQLKTLSKAKLEELFQGINKGDLKAIAQSILPEKPNDMDKNTFDALKSVLSATVTSMVENGMTLGSQEDIIFLEKHGSPAIQEKIKSAKMPGGELENFSGKLNIVIRGAGSNLEFIQILGDNGEVTKGLDISRLNTIDMKKSAEALKAQLPKMDMKGLEDMVNNLLKSDNKMLKGLGELFKIFGAFFGLKFDKKEGVEVGLNKKQKRDLMVNMLDPKNGRYDISKKFDVTTKESQMFLDDIRKLGFGEGIPEKDKEGKYIYSDKLMANIAEYSKKLGIAPPKVVLDKPWLESVISKLDPNTGEITDEKPIATEVPKEKHRLAEIMQDLNGKTYSQIRGNKSLVTKIQQALGVTIGASGDKHGIYGNATKSAVQDFQINRLQMIPGIGKDNADGKLGETTIQKIKTLYPDGFIPTPLPKK